MRVYLITAIFFLTTSLSFCQEQDAEELFQQANALYAQNNFEEAVSTYQKVLDKGYTSSAVYYNLGNAYYKLNRVAPSIYNYEKALQLSPNDKEIKNNLAFAQNMTIDAITPLPQNTFNKWYTTVLGVFSIDGWAVLTIVFIILFCLSFGIYYFSATTTRKRFFFVTMCLSILLTSIALVMAFQSSANQKNKQYAIVFSAEAEVHSGPTLGSDQAFILHEGTKLRIRESQGEWIAITLADGKEGWIPQSDIKKL